jgi:hypothetical protein
MKLNQIIYSHPQCTSIFWFVLNSRMGDDDRILLAIAKAATTETAIPNADTSCIPDDITYVTRARSPIATVAHEAERNPRQSHSRVRVCEDYNRVGNLPYL